MPESPSVEDLDKIRRDNEKLREQIAAEESKSAERLADQERQLQYTQLEAENVRLKAQLANAKELAKVGSVKAGAETVLNQAKEQLEQAVAFSEATPANAVDTNADNQPKDTTGATVATEENKSGGNS